MKDIGKLTILLCLICTSLCKGFTSSKSDSLYLQRADSLFELGEYRLASIEYDRAGFVTEYPDIKSWALVNKAECLKRLREYEAALIALSRISIDYHTDTLVYSIHYEKALINYLMGNFKEAENILSGLPLLVTDSSLTLNVLPLYALILGEQAKWNEASLKLEVFIREMNVPQPVKDSLNQIRKKLYGAKKQPGLKSIKTAQALAYIPGLGHFYAGYPLEGIVNIAFQAASVGFGYYTFVSRYYITTILVGLPVFEKFYIGAMNRVKYLVEKKNYEKISAYNKQLKFYILEVQKLQLTQ